MVAVSGVLLLYTAGVVPVQLFLWNYDEACNAFPTIYFDLVVDTFFMVGVCCTSVAPLLHCRAVLSVAPGFLLRLCCTSVAPRSRHLLLHGGIREKGLKEEGR